MVRVSAPHAPIKALSVSDGMMGTFNPESPGFPSIQARSASKGMRVAPAAMGCGFPRWRVGLAWETAPLGRLTVHAEQAKKSCR